MAAPVRVHAHEGDGRTAALAGGPPLAVVQSHPIQDGIGAATVQPELSCLHMRAAPVQRLPYRCLLSSLLVLYPSTRMPQVIDWWQKWLFRPLGDGG